MNIKLISKKCWEGRFITCPISKNVPKKIIPPEKSNPPYWAGK